MTGRAARGARISSSVLRDLLDVLVDATRGAVRLRVEGRSSAPGALPAWLSCAAQFDFIGVGEGSTALLIEAPQLVDIAPGLFQQRDLFHPFHGDCTALDLLEDSIDEASRGQLDTDLYDQGLLSTLRNFDRVLRSGYEAMEFGDVARPRPVIVGRETVDQMDRLLRATPPPQAARISGKLDTIRHSDRMFTLLLEDGQSLKGVAEGIATEKLAELFGSIVLVTGRAVFRPSGRILRLDADGVEGAGDGRAVWSTVPMPLFDSLDGAALRRPQGPRSGVNAIIGRWPGDEDDATFAGALEALS